MNVRGGSYESYDEMHSRTQHTRPIFREFCAAPGSFAKARKECTAKAAALQAPSTMSTCRGSSLHMGRAAVIWPGSCLSHREGANVSDFKNVSRCSKVKVKIECARGPEREKNQTSPIDPDAVGLGFQ